MKIVMMVAATGLVLFATGCTKPMMVSETQGELTGTTVQFIDTGVDMAGGPRIRQMIVYDANGNIIAGSHGVGVGSLQSSIPVIGGVAGTAIQGYYFNEGMKNLRPPEYNSSTTVTGGDTNVSNVIDGTQPPTTIQPPTSGPPSNGGNVNLCPDGGFWNPNAGQCVGGGR